MIHSARPLLPRHVEGKTVGTGELTGFKTVQLFNPVKVDLKPFVTQTLTCWIPIHVILNVNIRSETPSFTFLRGSTSQEVGGYRLQGLGGGLFNFVSFEFFHLAKTFPQG